MKKINFLLALLLITSCGGKSSEKEVRKERTLEIIEKSPMTESSNRYDFENLKLFQFKVSEGFKIDGKDLRITNEGHPAKRSLENPSPRNLHCIRESIFSEEVLTLKGQGRKRFYSFISKIDKDFIDFEINVDASRHPDIDKKATNTVTLFSLISFRPDGGCYQVSNLEGIYTRLEKTVRLKIDKEKLLKEIIEGGNLALINHRTNFYINDQWEDDRDLLGDRVGYSDVIIFDENGKMAPVNENERGRYIYHGVKVGNPGVPVYGVKPQNETLEGLKFLRREYRDFQEGIELYGVSTKGLGKFKIVLKGESFRFFKDHNILEPTNLTKFPLVGMINYVGGTKKVNSWSELNAEMKEIDGGYEITGDLGKAITAYFYLGVRSESGFDAVGVIDVYASEGWE